MPKILENVQMIGYQETPLEFSEQEDGSDSEKLTVRKLFLLGCNSFQGETMKEWKTIADIMTELDSEEKDNADLITLDDAWYDLLKKHLDSILPRAYKIHSPFMSEHIEKLAEAGEPKSKTKRSK